MREQIVHTWSEDGYLMAGAVFRPDGPARDTGVVFVHGLTGTFYGLTPVRLGRRLAEDGFVVVSGNNRGHDFGAVIRTRDLQTRLAGGGWELFDESPLDVSAWVSFASELGAKNVVLVGHSLGALKVCYYQATRQDPRVVGLVAASPPLRAGSTRPGGATKGEILALAERMVAEGRGRDLLPWDTFPAGAGTHSAQTYANRARTNLDVYGHETTDPAVARVYCPILAFYGTNEESVGSATDLGTIKRHARSSQRVDTRMFEGADHSYSDHEDEVADAIGAWIKELV
ncbi:MAG TPA: alpha/beta fold hydrolase [Chloroflexota bacterium]|nr:alpha/beta fold hydrolase [Chloroflexota bacterium]